LRIEHQAHNVGTTAFEDGTIGGAGSPGGENPVAFGPGVRTLPQVR